MEVFLTDKAGGGLGEATNLRTGERIKDFEDWNRTYYACLHKSNVTTGGNSSAREAVVQDTHDFLRSVFGR